MDEISLENSLRIIGKSELSHENSGEVPRAANFCSKIRGVETIGVAKMRRNIAENSFQRIFVEKPGNSSKFVCITFAQYCIYTGVCRVYLAIKLVCNFNIYLIM